MNNCFINTDHVRLLGKSSFTPAVSDLKCLETEKDHPVVEELTREAFWNVYKPRADEHYFVHMMRSHPDFIPELAFVLEKDGEIIGNIMYAKAWLEDEWGSVRRFFPSDRFAFSCEVFVD